MIIVSATKLRKNLFEYLDKIAKGETIIVRRNKRDVAQLVPFHKIDWRDKMKVQPTLLADPEKIIEPLDDVWEEYL